jgi:hypothetical protein
MMSLLGRFDRAVRSRLWFEGVMGILSRTIDAPGVSTTATHVRRATLAEIMACVPTDSLGALWDSVLVEARGRFSEGMEAYAAIEHGRLLHLSWLIPRTDRIGSDFGCRMKLDQPAGVLWGDFTDIAARGRGLHQSSIRARLERLGELRTVSWAVTGVRVENRGSWDNYARAGFARSATLSFRRRLGRRYARITDHSGDLEVTLVRA